ncbi:hypothetical protein B188_10220 [Candidatus Brocadiaceae bacterium B188]|nr:hypothetical protein [Candidatus Brocadia sapporoensis]QQR66136.1 MAG: hypothetical protein IPI25_11435 [Candidatus Brocadia sp.]RZV56499.1 MAG: hypothetical protein EX330_13335 [Candidatus Brocadia sp. BROELEC01]TWU53058.1 hypothetical protein B188_10220 [Candidatus Brocadiaceae bacterium B188]
MTGVKQQVIQMIQSLPGNVTINDIMADFYFRLRVDAGLKQLVEIRIISHEGVEKKDVQMACKIRWSPQATSNYALLFVMK